MFLKRKLWFIIYSLISLYASGLYAQKYKLSVIKTVEPVTSITWNKDGSNYAYAERDTVVIRNPNGNSLVQKIPTQKANIKLLKFSVNTQGLNKDELVTLHADGVVDFRILPEIETAISKNTENGEPTIVACSDNGAYFAVGTKRGAVILYKMDYAKQKAVASQIGNLGVPITALTFSRDSKNLLIGAADNSITRIDIDSKKIVNGYAYNAKNKVPILMTADSKSIIMTTGDSTIGFFDLSFNRYNYYTTYRDILSLHMSADNRFLIILTDDNVFSYYDTRTRELKKYIPAFNETKILSYAFNQRCDKVAISHEDGSLYVLDVNAVICDIDETRKDFTMTETAESEAEFNFTAPAPSKPAEPAPQQDLPVEEISDEEPVVEEEPPVEEPVLEEPTEEPVEEIPEELPEEEPEEIPEEEEKEEPKSLLETLKDIKEYKDEEIQLKFKNGHGLLVNIGWSLVDYPYTFELSLPVGYRNYNVLKPFYFGGTVEPSIGFPVYDFPYTYTFNGAYMESPKLIGTKIYVPFGFCMYPLKNDLEVYAEINLGVSLHWLWNGRFGNTAIAGSTFPAFYGSIKVGAAWKIFNLSICGVYDATTGIKFKIETGIIMNIGGIRKFLMFGSMAQYHFESMQGTDSK